MIASVDMKNYLRETKDFFPSLKMTGHKNWCDKLSAGVTQHSLAVTVPVYIHYKMPCPSIRLTELGNPVQGQLLTFNESLLSGQWFAAQCLTYGSYKYFST